MSNELTAKLLYLAPYDEGESVAETLWAAPFGDDRYTLDDSLFYADGVSWQGTVFSPVDLQDARTRNESRMTRRHASAPIRGPVPSTHPC